jgi:hypothetical protein
MSRKIKLDLHTHPIEALRTEMGIQGIRDINREVAAAIVKCVKAAGLDGIAITERNNFNHGWVASLEIGDYFQAENLIILPGSEIEIGEDHYLQIYIPDRIQRRVPFFKGKNWFLILAHPGNGTRAALQQSPTIEPDAVEKQSLRGSFTAAEQIASERIIPLVQTSDAHRLEDVGRLYTELEIR